ncbi:MAG: DedA family protein [Candidatus Freyarchaeum deiterrae]
MNITKAMDPISQFLAQYINFLMNLIPPSGLLQQLSRFLMNFISSVGYPGVFLLMIAESAVLPVPSEVVMPFAGYLAYTGTFDIWLVTLMGVLGNLVGSWIAYIVGLKVGRAGIIKYGKYILLRESHVEQAESWFQKYGDKAIFASRLLPVLRTVISLPAGIGKMDPKKFTLYTFVGSIPWDFALAYLGYTLGQNWNAIEGYFKYIDILIIVAAVAIIAFYIIRRRRRKSTQPKQYGKAEAKESKTASKAKKA